MLETKGYFAQLLSFFAVALILLIDVAVVLICFITVSFFKQLNDADYQKPLFKKAY